MGRIKYTKELLEEVVKRSTSMSQVIRSLGLSPSGGGSYYHLKRKIEVYGISTSHFVNTTTGSKENYGGGRKRRPNNVIFTIKPLEGPYESGSSLKRAMLEDGIAEVCSVCGIGTEWNGNSLSLHVDHINGV